LPENLRSLTGKFKQVLVPEMNMGQLSTLLRDKLNLQVTPFCKVTGQPFLIEELANKIRSLLPRVTDATSAPGAKGKTI
jgi:2-oxoglutarate ferredoxin oxidoreductase subunit alpha